MKGTILAVNGSRNGDGTPETFVRSALCYTSLVKVLSSKTTGPPLNFIWPANIAPISMLTRLDLRGAYLSAESLEKLLSTTPKLQVLEYHFFCNLEPRDGRATQLDCTD